MICSPDNYKKNKSQYPKTQTSLLFSAASGCNLIGWRLGRGQRSVLLLRCWSACTDRQSLMSSHDELWKSGDLRVTTFPRFSEDHEYQRWHRGRGAEVALVMTLSDFSKLYLHRRSPRRRSVSRSRSRYEQLFMIAGKVWGSVSWDCPFFPPPPLGLFPETGADIGLSPKRRITGVLDLCPGQGGA